MFWGGPSIIPNSKGRAAKVSAWRESLQTGKCCRKVHSKKKAKFLSFGKLAKIQCVTMLGQGVTCAQNAARLDAPTHLFTQGSRTPALCHGRTAKLHNLPGKATGLAHRVVTPWSIT